MTEKHEIFANQTYLDPRLDPAFKEFFDSEDALRDFLNGVLELDGDDKIRSLTFFRRPNCPLQGVPYYQGQKGNGTFC